jgi:hypothetical protein
LTTKTKGRSIKPTQAFDRTSRGQLLNADRSKDGNKSTNKNDKGATCRRWQCLQTKMSTSRFHPDTMQSLCCPTPTRAAVWWHTNQQYRNQKPFYRHTPNSSKSTKRTLRVRLTSKMLLKMLLSFCTFESTKPGNKSTLFPGLRSGFCTFESTEVQ